MDWITEFVTEWPRWSYFIIDVVVFILVITFSELMEFFDNHDDTFPGVFIVPLIAVAIWSSSEPTAWLWHSSYFIIIGILTTASYNPKKLYDSIYFLPVFLMGLLWLI